MTVNECVAMAENEAYALGVENAPRRTVANLSRALMETTDFRDFDAIPKRIAKMLARIERIKSKKNSEHPRFLRFRETCCARINVHDWYTDKLQTNSLRVESCIGSPMRCGERMPEHWTEGAKNLGSGRWLFSGGSPFVFESCEKKHCPRWDNNAEKAIY